MLIDGWGEQAESSDDFIAALRACSGGPVCLFRVRHAAPRGALVAAIAAVRSSGGAACERLSHADVAVVAAAAAAEPVTINFNATMGVVAPVPAAAAAQGGGRGV